MSSQPAAAPIIAPAARTIIALLVLVFIVISSLFVGALSRAGDAEGSAAFTDRSQTNVSRRQQIARRRVCNVFLGDTRPHGNDAFGLMHGSATRSNFLMSMRL
jgi:hypothetical protein